LIEVGVLSSIDSWSLHGRENLLVFTGDVKHFLATKQKAANTAIPNTANKKPKLDKRFICRHHNSLVFNDLWRGPVPPS
jgi:hypothetical protein